jgi:hypothetical protein
VPKGQDRDLAKARAAARRELQEQRAEIERVGGKKALENLEMDVETDADGQPAFIMVTAGVVKRTFGGADASSRRSDEVAYVSPAGVEYGNSDSRNRARARSWLRSRENCSGSCCRFVPSDSVAFRGLERGRGNLTATG